MDGFVDAKIDGAAKMLQQRRMKPVIHSCDREIPMRRHNYLYRQPSLQVDTAPKEAPNIPNLQICI